MTIKANTIFDSETMAQLLTLVEEGAKTDGEGVVKRFVEPASGTLRRATTKRHHIIFGRRGSGKSSLLRKASADLTVDRRPIAYVNLEKFKAHSYPDVLLSVLISTFFEFEKWLRTAAIHPANKVSFWKRIFGSKPNRAAFNKTKAEELARAIKEEIDSLEEQLYTADGVSTTRSVKNRREKHATTQFTGEIGHTGAKLESALSDKEKRSAEEERKEEFRHSKVDFLHRHILGYQKLFQRMSELSEGASYLFLDDLYHIRRADQPQLVDYFYRIAKDSNLWLKIGTIRYRTSWYIHGDPPIGVKLGDDAEEIDLDLTLEKYTLARNFLNKVLKNFVSECEGLKVSDIVNEGGIERLVLASGGVARDFLAIFRRSVDVARERGVDHRGKRIGSEDVNKAAGEHEPSKREELKRDAPDARKEIEEQFEQIIRFCVNSAKANVFLVDQEATGKNVELLHELVDLRLIHLVRSRVTVKNRPRKIFEGYMLDVSQYAGARKRRNFELVEFWKAGSDESLRRAGLIYDIVAAGAQQL